MPWLIIFPVLAFSFTSFQGGIKNGVLANQVMVPITNTVYYLKMNSSTSQRSLINISYHGVRKTQAKHII